MLSQDKDQNICHFYLKKSNSAHLQGNGVIDSTPQWKTVQINVQRRKEMMVENTMKIEIYLENININIMLYVILY